MSPNAADSTVSSAWSATYARRSMAFMMDGLLAFYVPAFFAIVLGVVVTQRAEMTEDEATEVVTVAAVLTGMAGLILHPVLFEGFFRRGPGKSVFGLHVVDTELRATTLRQRLVRALIKSLSLATCCLPAVALLAFAPQSLHDRAAETILIRKRGPLK